MGVRGFPSLPRAGIIPCSNADRRGGSGDEIFKGGKREENLEELRIVYLSPDKLTPYENNTRKHIHRMQKELMIYDKYQQAAKAARG